MFCNQEQCSALRARQEYGMPISMAALPQTPEPGVTSKIALAWTSFNNDFQHGTVFLSCQ
eukprot:5383576-Lingulodinium_polyedra.AAC.1